MDRADRLRRAAVATLLLMMAFATASLTLAMLRPRSWPIFVVTQCAVLVVAAFYSTQIEVMRRG